MIRKTKLEIDLDVITDNAVYLKSLSDNAFFCPMLKANAYGHGDVEVARALKTKGIFHFGLALYEEALALRQKGIQQSDLVVFAPMSRPAVAVAEEHRLQPVIVRLEDLQLLESHLQKPIAVHLKVDTSMHRLGISENEIEQAKSLFAKSRKVKLIGLCTHLPNAEDLDQTNSTTLASLQKFEAFCEKFPGLQFYHALNSSALLMLDKTQSEFRNKFGARPGISLYGAWPSERLKEAMTIKTQILQIHQIEKGEGVSYGHIWKAERDSLVGVLPIGYADGVRRKLSGQLYAKVRGKKLPIIGRICMDYILIDLTDLGLSRELLLNEEVVLLDAGVADMNTSSWANRLDTIPYEVMTSFTGRLHREYI